MFISACDLVSATFIQLQLCPYSTYPRQLGVAILLLPLNLCKVHFPVCHRTGPKLATAANCQMAPNGLRTLT